MFKAESGYRNKMKRKKKERREEKRPIYMFRKTTKTL